jgi:hypothetical protein
VFFSRSKFKEWIAKKHGSYSLVRTELTKIGVLKDANRRKALGADTEFVGGIQPCWVIDATNPAMGIVAAVLVRDVELAAERAIRSV